MSTRDDVLRAVVELGQAADVPAIAAQAGTTDFHSVVHHLFMLRRDGLVTFRERRIKRGLAHGRSVGSGVNGGRVPADIRPVVHAITAHLVGKG